MSTTDVKGAGGKIGLILLGILVGSIIGGIGGFWVGQDIGFLKGKASEISKKPQEAARLALAFNQRIEDNKAALRDECFRLGNRCNRQNVDTMIIALDAVKIDEATIRSWLGRP